MKIIWQFKLACLFLLGLISLFCKTGNQKDQKTSGENSKYSKMEIYCWCLYTAKIEKEDSIIDEDYIIDACTITPPQKPGNLVKPKYLLDTTSDSNKIGMLQKLFFDAKIASDTLTMTEGSDARLVILFRKNDFEADTLVYLNLDKKKFTYNEKYEFSYAFNVLDSVRTILNINEFACVPYNVKDSLPVKNN